MLKPVRAHRRLIRFLTVIRLNTLFLHSVMAIPVFYSEKLLADAESESPSAHKPREVLASWFDLNIPLSLQTPSPLSCQLLSLAHAPDYVDGVLAGQLKNGYGNHQLSVANSLPYLAGATLGAAQAVLQSRSVAIAPIGPCHQAGYRSGAADATFNALLITALALKRQRRAERIGIIDLSREAALGSADIIKRIPDNDWLKHLDATSLPCRSDADIAALSDAVLDMADCELILCQASVDSHHDDLGGGWLDAEQLYQRDLNLFRTAQEWCLPLVLTLGAGHQRDQLGKLTPLLVLHDNTLRALATALAN